MSLRYLTAGESHGKAVLVVVEGMPAGLGVSKADIDHELKRRQQGYGRGGRMKIESDHSEFLSGVRHGKTIGSPVAMMVSNRDFKNWMAEMSVDVLDDFESRKLIAQPRPGHADLSGGLKYDHHDLRNVLERSSARETVARVAAGALAKVLLREFDVLVRGHVTKIGGVSVGQARPPLGQLFRQSEKSQVRCFDHDIERKMIAKIDQAKRAGDTVGGVFEVVVTGLVPGLGSHVHYDRKLDGRIAQALMSIQAIKGVSVGLGFAVADLLGSEVHDEIFYSARHKRFYRQTNRAGGLEGGMSNGMELVVQAAMKPISTLYRPLASVNIVTKKPFKASVERSDTCAVPAACVIGEAVVAFAVAHAFLEKFGGDSLKELRRNYHGYGKQIEDF